MFTRVMGRYQDFNFDTITIRYLPNIAISIRYRYIDIVLNISITRYITISKYYEIRLIIKDEVEEIKHWKDIVWRWNKWLYVNHEHWTIAKSYQTSTLKNSSITIVSRFCRKTHSKLSQLFILAIWYI